MPPSIHEQLQQKVLSGVIEPSQRGVDALDVAQNALALSRGLIEGAVGDASESPLRSSADLLSQANQKLAEALGLFAQISDKTQRFMNVTGLSVPGLCIPSPPSVVSLKLPQHNPIRLNGNNPQDVPSAESGPLDTVRTILTTHTDRNPPDNEAIVAMMQNALRELGPDGEYFSEELIGVLDPYAERVVSARTVATIANLGALTTDESMSRGARWGALSLIGAVALAERPEADAVQTDASSAIITHYAARQTLQTIVETDGLEEMYRTSAQALLSQEGFPVEDIAIDLELGGLNKGAKERQTSPLVQEANNGNAEEARVLGASISDNRRESVFALGPDVQTKIEAMDWLDLDANIVGDVRDVYHDGNIIARVVDLTATHSLLGRLKKELEGHAKVGQQFWPQLAANIVHFSQARKFERLARAKVPTFYMRNKGGFNETVVRAYYVPLGNDTSGVTLLGLIAAYRTKNDQSNVAGIISNARHLGTRREV